MLFVQSILVVSGRRVNTIHLTPPWLEGEYSFRNHFNSKTFILNYQMFDLKSDLTEACSIYIPIPDRTLKNAL